MPMYSKGITLKKMVYQGVMALISGGIPSLAAYMNAIPVDQVPIYFGVLLVIVKGAENWLKHRDD